ncbi:hypothetical protein J437_LFUL011120 [Ladona fulva]|uniref:Uncharacterized protein n=1 Tax=Ladona fulva TaxID=123851 RepID=A0A8K0KBT6_LADFU|nr:hypothetical protein J437_LFUL011120 [Ladona fulva]
MSSVPSKDINLGKSNTMPSSSVVVDNDLECFSPIENSMLKSMPLKHPVTCLSSDSLGKRLISSDYGDENTIIHSEKNETFKPGNLEVYIPPPLPEVFLENLQESVYLKHYPICFTSTPDVFHSSENLRDHQMNNLNPLIRPLQRLYKQGGKGLEPYYNLIEGGAEGSFLQQAKEYFCLGKIFHQGFHCQHQMDSLIKFCDIANVMRSLGYYPTEKEIKDMTKEILLNLNDSEIKEFGKTSFEDLIRLYINHRPAKGISLQQITSSFKFLSKGGSHVSKDKLKEILTQEGEMKSRYEIPTYLQLLFDMRFGINGDKRSPSTEGDQSQELVVAVEVLVWMGLAELVSKPVQELEKQGGKQEIVLRWQEMSSSVSDSSVSKSDSRIITSRSGGGSSSAMTASTLELPSFTLPDDLAAPLSEAELSEPLPLEEEAELLLPLEQLQLVPQEQLLPSLSLESLASDDELPLPLSSIASDLDGGFSSSESSLSEDRLRGGRSITSTTFIVGFASFSRLAACDSTCGSATTFGSFLSSQLSSLFDLWRSNEASSLPLGYPAAAATFSTLSSDF